MTREEFLDEAVTYEALWNFCVANNLESDWFKSTKLHVDTSPVFRVYFYYKNFPLPIYCNEDDDDTLFLHVKNTVILLGILHHVFDDCDTRTKRKKRIRQKWRYVL